jgi:hypothetical protein
MDEKKIKIAVPASGEDCCREVILHPGYTVRDLKRQFPEFDDYSIFKGWDSLPFKEDINIYEKVKPNSQLYAASYQDVGFNLAAKK